VTNENALSDTYQRKYSRKKANLTYI